MFLNMPLLFKVQYRGFAGILQNISKPATNETNIYQTTEMNKMHDGNGVAGYLL